MAPLCGGSEVPESYNEPNRMCQAALGSSRQLVVSQVSWTASVLPFFRSFWHFTLLALEAKAANPTWLATLTLIASIYALASVLSSEMANY